MKRLKDKTLTNGELTAYLKNNVSQEAFSQNRQQEPMLSGNPNNILFVNKILLIIILVLSFITLAKGDNISDFEIEGVSVGDSLLNYFSESEINNKKIFYKEDKKKIFGSINLNNIKIYDAVEVLFKNDDPKFRIVVITGFLWYDNDITDCLKKKSEIIEDLKPMLSNIDIIDQGKHEHFLHKKSYTYSTYFNLSHGYPRDHIIVSCYDWSNKSGYRDNLRVGFVKSEYTKFLMSLKK